MGKSKEMPLAEHMKTADDLAVATHHLTKIFFRCQEYYPKSSRLIKLLSRVLPGTLNGVFTQIKSELDTEYHKLITDAAFDEYGHIYYNLEERYNAMGKEG